MKSVTWSAFASLSFVLVASFSCGGAVADCVQNYFDGISQRQSEYTQGECEARCAEAAELAPTALTTCFWTGRVALPSEPTVTLERD